MFADFPFSVLEFYLLYARVHPLVCFALLGTLWWYFLSYGIWRWVNKLTSNQVTN